LKNVSFIGRFASLFQSAFLLTLVLIGSMLTQAQEVTAGVFGTVQDSSGAVVPGAQIHLRNTETQRTWQTPTDASGNFVVRLLPIGNYELAAEAAGFKKSIVSDVLLRVNDNRRVIFEMEVGTVADQVVVEAAAVTVNVANGTTSQLLDGQDMVNMPSQGRNVQTFAQLMPGVVSTTPYDRRANNSSVNGVRPTHNAWLIDGGYNIDTGGNWGTPLAPNMESVAEFRAIRGNYSAEFGTGGGAQFNVVTRGGTNQLHGSLYYFHRNDKLNARNFFSATREPFKGNDFGGTIGGPVFIPKFYDGRNKTFFFVLLGGVTERKEQRFNQIVPTAAQRVGNFSSRTTPLRDPSTGGFFANNIIPSSMIDANAAAYMRMYPDPNFMDSAGRNWSALQGRSDDRKEFNFRVDHNFSDSHRVMWRYTPETRTSFYRQNSGFDWMTRDDRTPARNMTVNFNSSLKPNLINDFTFVRSHNRIMQFPADVSPTTWGINIPQLFEDTAETYPLASLNLSQVPVRVPAVSLTNYAGLTASAPWSNYQTIYDFKNNLTWIHGAHTLKFGGVYSYEIKFEPTDTNVFGSLSFDGRNTGDALADMLIGRAASYSETNTVAFNDNRRNSFEVYANDSWQVTRTFNIDIGLRYSYFPPAYEPDDRFRVFLPDAYDTSQAVTVNNSGQVVRNTGNRFNGLVNPKSHWQTHKKNFAPRLSFAWDPFGKGKTSVRGGYGLFYSREILGAFILMSANPPFSESVTVENTLLSNPGGGTTRNYDLPITLGSIDMNQLTPYTQQWNFNIQHSLGGNTVLEVGYSGSRGVHMMRTQDINQPLPSAAIAQGTANANQARPYKGWGVINHREQSYSSNYHGLQTSLNRNFSKGLMIQAAYTWSKAIDNADFTGGIYGFVPNTLDSSGERGRANFDATHNFVSSFVWDVPFLKSHSGFVGKVLGGWQISGVGTLRTGLPINPQLGRDYAGVGSSSRQRPEALRNPTLPSGDRSVDAWFDASAFVAPAFGTFASTGRNVISGPGYQMLDMSFQKIIRLGESQRLEIRGDGFNVLNHTQFDGIGSTFTTPATFGRVTSTRNERSFMLGARLQF